MIKVFVMGTDPSSGRGGVSIALRGYLSALDVAGIPFEMLITHREQGTGARYWPWLKAIVRVVSGVIKAKREGYSPVVYAHAGAAPSLLRKFVLLWICNVVGAKTVLQLHAIQVRRYLNGFWTRILFKVGVRGVDVLCVLTAWWKAELEAAGIKLPIMVIPNPLPLEWARCASWPKRMNNSDELAVCLVSRLEEGKGVDLAIEAMQFLPSKTHLFIAGSGSQMSRLQLLAARLSLEERVHFMGWLDNDGKRELMDRSDVFCLPSSFDSFGMGFVEAMASGLPVVALNIPPISDVVPNGVAGILADDRNPESIAKAIEKLKSVAVRQTMSKAAQEWVLSQFSAEVVGGKLKEALGN